MANIFGNQLGTGSTRIFGVQIYVAPSATRVVSEVLADRFGVVAANLTGIKGAWFDQGMPHQLLAAMDVWTNGTTNASGMFTRVVSSNLPSGGQGLLVVSDSDNNPLTIHKCYFGRVTVT